MKYHVFYNVMSITQRLKQLILQLIKSKANKNINSGRRSNFICCISGVSLRISCEMKSSDAYVPKKSTGGQALTLLDYGDKRLAFVKPAKSLLSL